MLLPLLVSCSAACGAGQDPRGDAIEILLPTPPANLDPRFATDAASMRISRLLHAGLTRLDERTLMPVPYLARRWEHRGDRVLFVELRDDVRFTSGAPFEAPDVCATLTAFADPGLGSPHRAVAASIEACAPQGPSTLILTLAEGRASLLSDLEVPVLRRDQAHGRPMPEGGLDGLGPYRLGEATGAVTSLLPRDGGALPRPAHPVIVRVVRDENARAVRLMADRADIVPNGLSPVLLSALGDRGGLVRSSPGANLTYLLLHNERAPFQSREAREAAARSLDRTLLAKTVLGGRARVAQGVLPPESWAAPGDLAPIPFDPVAARARIMALPSRTLTLLTSTDRARISLSRAMAQMLTDAGFTVEVVPLDLGVLLARLSAGDFEAALLQIPELTEPNVLRWFFHSSAIPGRGPGGANRARFENAEADALLDVAAVEPDLDKRKIAYAGVSRILQRELPVVPLFHEDQVAAVSARAAGFTLSAEGRWLSVAMLP